MAFMGSASQRLVFLYYLGGSQISNPLPHHDEMGWSFETSLDVD